MAAPEEGIGELWAIASAVGPVDVRVFVLLQPGFKYGLTNKPQMLLSGVPLQSAVVQNLGAIPIELGASRGLIYGEGVRVPPNSQWSIGGVAPIGASGTDTSIARPQWFDRNPATHGLRFVTLVGAHALVTRWTYTVPANRKAFVQSVLGVLVREVADAAPGLTTCDITASLNGGVEFVNYARAAFWNGAVDARDKAVLSQVGAVLAGDILRMQTSDGSTGVGSTLFDGSASLVEFDA